MILLINLLLLLSFHIPDQNYKALLMRQELVQLVEQLKQPSMKSCSMSLVVMSKSTICLKKTVKKCFEYYTFFYGG